MDESQVSQSNEQQAQPSSAGQLSQEPVALRTSNKHLHQLAQRGLSFQSQIHNNTFGYNYQHQ